MDQANWYNRISERGPKMKKSILEISCHYLIIMIFFIFLFYSCCHSPFHSPCPESNWGSAYLCSECEDLAFITNIGTCEVCGRGTSSGAFRLCNSCACKLKECQHCRKILRGLILKEDLFSTWPIERELEELKKASIAPDSQSLSGPGNA